jgi:hypothetical protein
MKEKDIFKTNLRMKGVNKTAKRRPVEAVENAKSESNDWRKHTHTYKKRKEKKKKAENARDKPSR